jgi:hypothetical protein
MSYEQQCTCGHSIERHDAGTRYFAFACEDCSCQAFDRDEALEPKLTKADRRILAAIPEGGDDEYRFREIDEAVTVWQIAEAIDSIDLVDLRRTLSGLDHLGYIRSSTSKSRKREVHWRTRKGDGAVAAERKAAA